jgi:hypothetical protein
MPAVSQPRRAASGTGMRSSGPCTLACPCNTSGYLGKRGPRRAPSGPWAGGCRTSSRRRCRPAVRRVPSAGGVRSLPAMTGSPPGLSGRETGLAGVKMSNGQRRLAAGPTTVDWMLTPPWPGRPGDRSAGHAARCDRRQDNPRLGGAPTSRCRSSRASHAALRHSKSGGPAIPAGRTLLGNG